MSKIGYCNTDPQTRYNKMKESEIRYRITCLEITISQVEKTNHFKIKFRAGLLYGRIDDLLEILEQPYPDWQYIEKQLDLVEYFIQQL